MPYPAGGTSDILARTSARSSARRSARPVVVENRPGANGNIGAEIVAKAPPDGYTILLADIGASRSARALPKLPFDPVKDFAPVTLVATRRTSSSCIPACRRNVKELIALAKAKPGKLNFAVVDGSAPHLAGVEFAHARRHRWAYIPYKGGAQAVTDVVGGQADCCSTACSRYPRESGKLKLLAVSSAKRVAAIPDVPTVADRGCRVRDRIVAGHPRAARHAGEIVSRSASEVQKDPRRRRRSRRSSRRKVPTFA